MKERKKERKKERDGQEEIGTEGKGRKGKDRE